MQRMTMSDFSTEMYKLKARYTQQLGDPKHFAMSIAEYWTGLQHYDAERILRAFRQAHLLYPQFMPSLGEMVAMIEGTVDLQLKALQAWSEVKVLARKSSSDHPDRLAKKMMVMQGGGSAYGRMDDRQFEAAGKEFMGGYIALAKRVLRGDSLPELEAPSEGEPGEIKEAADVSKLITDVATGMTMPGDKEDKD